MDTRAQLHLCYIVIRKLMSTSLFRDLINTMRLAMGENESRPLAIAGGAGLWAEAPAFLSVLAFKAR